MTYAQGRSISAALRAVPTRYALVEPGPGAAGFTARGRSCGERVTQPRRGQLKGDKRAQRPSVGPNLRSGSILDRDMAEIKTRSRRDLVTGSRKALGSPGQDAI